MIKENIEKIREKIKTACQKSGRNSEDITIVAATKKVEFEKIIEAVKCGINNLGESYFQEAINKIQIIKEKVRWHFVGHLQKNKAAKVVSLFDLIQSVDSRELLFKINAAAKDLNKVQNILLQVNIAKEESKFGIAEKEVFDLLRESEELSNVKILGLMIIPPLQERPENNRVYFRRLFQLSKEINKLRFKNWENKYLSMGMSADYNIAVSEGANMVRIGTAIFGER